MKKKITIHIRNAQESDISTIVQFITDLAEFENLSDQVEVNDEKLRETLFGHSPAAEVLIAETAERAIGFALFFHNYSTFLGRPGIYIEDLFVDPAFRGNGAGRKLLSRCAQIAKERRCGRLEWAVLTWNPARNLYNHIGAELMDEWLLYRLTGNNLDRLAREEQEGMQDNDHSFR